MEAESGRVMVMYRAGSFDALCAAAVVRFRNPGMRFSATPVEDERRLVVSRPPEDARVVFIGVRPEVQRMRELAAALSDAGEVIWIDNRMEPAEEFFRTATGQGDLPLNTSLEAWSPLAVLSWNLFFPRSQQLPYVVEAAQVVDGGGSFGMVSAEEACLFARGAAALQIMDGLPPDTERIWGSLFGPDGRVFFRKIAETGRVLEFGRQSPPRGG